MQCDTSLQDQLDRVLERSPRVAQEYGITKAEIEDVVKEIKKAVSA
jgi:uncharacterized protein (UPF0335 family)